MFKNLNCGALGHKATFEEHVELAKKYGFGGVDPDLGYAREKGVTAVKDLLARNGLKLGGFGLGVNWRDNHSDKDYADSLESFIKEIGLGIQFININKCVGRPVSFSSAFIKGYCTSLAKVSNAVKIDLLAAKEKSLKKVSSESKAEVSPIFLRFKSEMAIPLICLGVGLIVVMLGRYRIVPLENQIKNIRSMRPAVSTVSADTSYDELVAIEATYKTKTKTMEDLLKKQIYFTKVLEVIPKSLSKEVRLEEFSFMNDEGKSELMLYGTAYLGDSDKEIEIVNSFLARLKENSVLNQYFKDIGLLSVDYGKVKEVNMTHFSIYCRSYKDKK